MFSKLLVLIGIVCIGLYGFSTFQASLHQAALQEELYQPLRVTAAPLEPGDSAEPAREKTPQEGDLFGRLEIPRLNMSVMVMEGDQDETLRLGAGHIPGTPMAIAGHRDSFFRPLKDIKVSDTIRFTTLEGTTEYHVTSAKIVGPKDTYVIDNQPDDTMTLVTCYPFQYIGPAPKRFIVEATKN